MEQKKESRNEKAVVKVLIAKYGQTKADNKRIYIFRKKCERCKSWLNKNDVSQKKILREREGKKKKRLC